MRSASRNEVNNDGQKKHMVYYRINLFGAFGFAWNDAKSA